MICERTRQFHVRQLGKMSDDLVYVGSRSVKITFTPCKLGGQRAWFLCPSCGRRCSILYPERCRKCVDGRYSSELLSPHRRRIAKAIKLRERLGQRRGGIVALFPEKPKRMRWHTYLGLREKGIALEREIWAADYASLFGPNGTFRRQ